MFYSNSSILVSNTNYLCEMGLPYIFIFTVTNGVRQGGILSPKLFSVYVNDLSKIICRSGVGCAIDDVSINHVFYADDMYIMAPSLAETYCYKYSICNFINFNPLKSV